VTRTTILALFGYHAAVIRDVSREKASTLEGLMTDDPRSNGPVPDRIAAPHLTGMANHHAHAEMSTFYSNYYAPHRVSEILGVSSM
jgi:hypothetical protein